MRRELTMPDAPEKLWYTEGETRVVAPGSPLDDLSTSP